MENKYLGSFATGTIAQAIQIGSALALLPLIGIYLTAEEIGVWYLLLTFQSLILLVDSGSSQGFVRFYSLARFGASRFTDSGFVGSGAESAKIALLSNLVVINRYWHGFLGVLFLVLGLPLIWLIVVNGIPDDSDLVMLAFGCILFGAGNSLYLSSSWMAAFLFSLELQSSFFRYLILYRLLFLVLAAAMLFFEFGFVALGIANLLAVSVAVFYIRSRFRSASRGYFSLGSYDRALVGDIWKVWAKNVVVAFGGFLGNRGVLIIVAAAYGLSVAGVFGVSMQLFFAVLAVSQLVFQLAAPRMSELRVKDRLTELRSLVTRLMFYYIALFLAGAVTVILLVPEMLGYLDSNIQLLSTGLLILMGVIYGLEGNHSNFALAISTENRIPYFLPSIITASIIFVGTVFVGYAGFSIVWVLVVQGAAHLLYNSWKWPLMFYSSIRAVRNYSARESSYH